MNEKQIQEVMALVDEYAKVWSMFTSTCETKQIEQSRAAIESALRESFSGEKQREVPEGWKPVPVEPTDAMVQAAYHLDLSYMPGQEGADRAAIYRAMLSAAPTQPAQVEQPAPAGSGGWEAHSEDMERERNYWRSRANLMHEHQNGQVWYWQGDGEDHLESICNSLPVVIRADALRELVANSLQPAQVSQPKAAQQEPVLCVLTEDLQRLQRNGWTDTAVRAFLPGAGELLKGVTMLYTAAAPQREPMTDEQWKQRLGDRQLFTILEAIRFVEREYGITKKE